MMAMPIPTWPANTSRNLYAVPPSSMTADFDSERERIFLPEEEDEEINISVIELSPGAGLISQVRKRDFASTEDVLRYTEERRALSCHGATTIIIINQLFSWGPLEISSTATQALLASFNISPGFWGVLKLFGCKETDEREAAGGLNEVIVSDDDTSFEISYTAKHAEKHNRPEREAYDPWSIRQIGVSYRHSGTGQSNTFVLVNPSEALLERVHGLNGDIEMLGIHRLIICAVTEHWGQYLAYLESVCKNISKRAVLAKAQKKVADRGFEVHFSDSQRIRDLQDTVIHVSHMLDLNLSISENLLASAHLFDSTSQSRSETKSTQSSILTLSAQTKQWRCHVENLLRRLDGSSVLVRSILDAKALETLQTSAATSAELAVLARQDALKAKNDARTLNTITILGFVYLPASFVATLLGTQYINIHDNDGGHISISLAPEMWIFATLTVILLIATGGGWLVWERHNKLADRAEAEKSGKTV